VKSCVGASIKRLITSLAKFHPAFAIKNNFSEANSPYDSTPLDSLQRRRALENDLRIFEVILEVGGSFSLTTFHSKFRLKPSESHGETYSLPEVKERALVEDLPENPNTLCGSTDADAVDRLLYTTVLPTTTPLGRDGTGRGRLPPDFYEPFSNMT